jgi:hypothetical protein
MALGPVEYIIIEFPGSQLRGEILPALKDLVAKGIIHIIDLVVVKKDANGDIQWLEVDQLSGSEARLASELEGEIDDIVNAEDIQLVAQNLAPNSTAGILVWENTWATQFATAVRNAQGRVLAHERVPAEIVQAALDASHPVSPQH